MSALAINHNLMAANTANTLSRHYSNLATSTQRLSSGLRINSAADDAAGLAIRELQRADISALHQGARNTNDAISMIQTFDGALSVIDEKLIRMKELAEQASTGTYSSTQRLMIASEFEAMGSEINRIARATDFNGIKLIDGIDGVRVAAHAGGIAAFAAINSPDGSKQFDVSPTGNTVNGQLNATIASETAWDTSGITDPEALMNLGTINIINDGAIKFGDKYLLVTPNNIPTVPAGTTLSIGYNGGWQISATDAAGTALATSVQTGSDQSCMFSITDAAGTINSYIINVFNPDSGAIESINGTVPTTTWTAPANDHSFTSSHGTVNATYAGNQLTMTVQLDANNSISKTWTIRNGNAMAVTEVSVDLNVRDITPPPPPGPGPNPPGPGPNPPGPGEDPDSPLRPGYQIPDDVVRIHFGPGADSREDFYDIKKYDATLRGLGLEDVRIETQESAQNALVRINDAITAKDKIRADYGAMQNRLENTLSNLTIQAENLQAAESRISDVDVATEMTNFVRNQILTQSAVAMLGQANSLPQMAMQLIG